TAGLYVLRLTATDSELSASADVSVNVIQANRPPTVSAGLDQMLVPPADTLILQGSVADDGLPSGTLTSSWSMVRGPGTVVFATPAAASTTATFTAQGLYVLRLTASDGELQASDDATVAVDAVLLSLEPKRAGPNVRGRPPGVNGTARPFTDLVAEGAGNVSGTIVAEGNGVRAGTGGLESFSAVFTGELVVAAAGDVTFAFHSADGFVFGVGGGASR